MYISTYIYIIIQRQSQAADATMLSRVDADRAEFLARRFCDRVRSLGGLPQ